MFVGISTGRQFVPSIRVARDDDRSPSLVHLHFIQLHRGSAAELNTNSCKAEMSSETSWSPASATPDEARKEPLRSLAFDWESGEPAGSPRAWRAGRRRWRRRRAAAPGPLPAGRPPRASWGTGLTVPQPPGRTPAWAAPALRLGLLTAARSRRRPDWARLAPGLGQQADAPAG